MANPILQMLNTNRKQNNINQIMGLLNGNPQQIIDGMLNNNPQFKKFVDDNKDLTAQQICQKYGVDPSIINMIK